MIFRQEHVAFQLIAAPFTPFDSDRSVQYDLIPAYAQWLGCQKVDGVFVNGTTGEGMSLTVDERKRLVEAWRRELPQSVRLIVHVGHVCAADAMDLARHAEAAGVDGIACIGSIFFTPPSSKAFVAASRQIAAAAPHTPYYAYHIPSMSRFQAPVSDWWQSMVDAVPNFKGVKFTYEDIEDYAMAVKLAGADREIFFGRDEILLQGLQAGAQSAVGSTYNLAAPLYRKIINAYNRSESEEAAALQQVAWQGIQDICAYGGLEGIKAVTFAFAQLGSPRTRLPLEEVAHDDVLVLLKRLEDSGYREAVELSMGTAPDAPSTVGLAKT